MAIHRCNTCGILNPTGQAGHELGSGHHVLPGDDADWICYGEFFEPGDSAPSAKPPTRSDLVTLADVVEVARLATFEAANAAVEVKP